MQNSPRPEIKLDTITIKPDLIEDITTEPQFKFSPVLLGVMVLPFLVVIGFAVFRLAQAIHFDIW